MAVSLFEKYGGFASISKIVMSFYDKVLESDLTGPYFDDIDMRRLVDHQTKFVASVMGGPASYADDVLRRVHAPYSIDRAAFDEMTRLLRETLVEYEFQPADIDTVVDHIRSKSGLVIAHQP
ncbi:MAG: truncated hemoglobin [Alphaproteobacteria bacterium]